MTIKKIGLVVEKTTLQSVFDGQGMTAIEVAAAASAKVDECVDLVNNVEQIANEATAIVDEMHLAQDQFIADVADTRAQLVNDNQEYIDGLTASKTTFETNMTNDLNTFKAGLNTSKATFEGDMTAALDTFEAGLATSKTTIEGNMTTEFNTFKNGLNTSKATFEGDMTAALDTFEAGLNTSTTTFETNMTNAVNTIIAEADADIVAAVNTKIVALEADGTLATIINEEIFNELNNKIDAIETTIKSVLEYGAKGDGVTFDDVAFQTAINENKVLYVPATASFYRLQHKLTIPSDRMIIGLGLPYLYNDTANGEAVFEVVGTSGNRKKNVTLQGLKIRNGTASTGDYTMDKDGITVKYCDGFTMEGCEVTEIQGMWGLATRYSTNINIKNNKFYRCTYAQMLVLPECENIRVEGNTFDTCTSTTEVNTYLFATGGDGVVDQWSVKNLWIRNNKFLNNPRWEGIDTHGCENLWIENNYIENVKCGIMVGLALDQVSNPILKNIHVLRNSIMQGSGQANSYGLVIQGNYNSGVFVSAENVTVKNNEIVGFGASIYNTVGALNINCTKNIVIEENTIREFKAMGIVLEHNNIDVKILNNVIVNATAKHSGGVSIGIAMRSIGCDAVIKDNVIFNTETAKAIDQGIDVASSFNHIIVGANKIISPLAYSTVANYNTGKASTPSGIMGIQGDIANDTYNMPKYYCTDAVIRYSSSKSSGISVSGNAGTNEFTITAGTFLNLIPNMEIVIAGAGAAGATLTTTIIKLTNNKITVKDNISTSVSNAGLSYTNANWTAL